MPLKELQKKDQNEKPGGVLYSDGNQTITTTRRSTDKYSNSSELSGETSVVQISLAGPSNNKQSDRNPKKKTHSIGYLRREESGSDVISNRPFKCNNCGRCYKQNIHLAQHLKFKCGIDPSFLCTQCGHAFSMNYNLRQHLVNVHKVDRSQLANFAPEEKVRQNHPFKCDKCKRTYQYSKQGLLSHLKYECGKPFSFACTLCDHRTLLKGNFRDHLVNVHGVEPAQFAAFGVAFSFQCKSCPFRGKNQTHYQKHIEANRHDGNC